MIGRKPLKSQFAIAFILIIIYSIIATIVTYYAGYIIYIYIEYKRIYPANYYEKKIPAIEDYIRDKGTVILNPEEKKSLEKIIPIEGITYQVMDTNGNKIYGTDNQRIIITREEFYRYMNSNIGVKGKYISLIPVIDSYGKIDGGVALTYTLTPYYASTPDKVWIITLFIVVLFSPFIYIVIFTLLFSKKFADNIGKPVNMLIDASRKVKEKNLDFNIDYYADNELGRLCEAFNDMKNELKNSLFSQWKIEQERHEMVEALAHDLKTPFSVIQGCVEFLIEGSVHDRSILEKYLNMIKDNATRGSSLIKEMLYAAELESTPLELNFVPVDIESFIKGKKESYEVISKNKNINFDVNISDNRRDKKPCTVDSFKLERILDNIVLNSIRYTPDNGIIKIDVKIQDERLFFTICDSGHGFSNKDLSNIFNKFYRGDESRSSKTCHAGLGLYIAKQLIEMMGGIIKAYNAKDGGACIEFYIRLKY